MPTHGLNNKLSIEDYVVGVLGLDSLDAYLQSSLTSDNPGVALANQVLELMKGYVEHLGLGKKGKLTQ